jgi:uncharacterized protein YecE (DUF72 family)
MASSSLHIGISGWTYAPWRGVFFPADLKPSAELAYASRQVGTIEINGTFYSLQRPESFGRWAKATPDHFLFSVKAPRFITHIKRLKDIRAPLANFFASGPLRLGPKLGPILWQLPPSFRYDPDRLEDFLSLLPRDTSAAARLARAHDSRIVHAWSKTDGERPLRHALEIRHDSFCCPEFVAQLRQHRVALVVADTAGKWPLMEDVTSDFIYVRLHGDEELYVSGYTLAALRDWAAKIRSWSRGRDAAGAKLTGPPAAVRKAGRDVFVYFDNDVKVRAPYDAMRLAHLLNVGPAPGRPPPLKQIKEVARTRWPGFPRRARSNGRSSGKS